MISVFDQGPPPPCPSPFNLARHVLRHATDMPDKTALSLVGPGSGQDLTYRDLDAAVRGTGAGLLALGLTEGDRVLIRLGNTPDFPIVYLGAIAAGLVPIPTSAQLTETEVATITRDMSPAAILRDPGIAAPPHPITLTGDEVHALRRTPPCDFAMGDPERPAYIVYTSGTSGKPRAVAHANGPSGRGR